MIEFNHAFFANKKYFNSHFFNIPISDLRLKLQFEKQKKIDFVISFTFVQEYILQKWL